jgi:hypothetical protein
LAAPWNRNSNLLYTGRDDKGHIRYIDMSYMDPYNWWKRPVTAVFRNQPWERKMADVMVEMFEPFFGTDITAEAVFEVLANKRLDTGSKIWNESDPWWDQWRDGTLHLAKELQPGVTSNIIRTWKAIEGDYSPSGKKYNVSDELMGWLGWRVTTLDPKISLYYRTFEFKDGKAEALRAVKRTLRNPNEVSKGELSGAYRESSRKLQKTYKDMGLIVSMAIKNGLSNKDAVKVMQSAGLSSKDIALLMKGIPPKWTPTEAQVESDATVSEVLRGGGRKTVKRYRDFIETLKQSSKTADD